MTDHPLTETAAAELWDEHVPPQLNFQGWTWDDRRSILDALRAAHDAGREHERTTPAEVTEEMRRAAASAYEDRAQVTRPENHEKCLNAALSAALAVATPADPHHDPRPWQDCTREDLRKGDLVQALLGDSLRIGVAHHQDEDGEWCTDGDWYITSGTVYPLRRIPAPAPPAEEVELPGEHPAHLLDARGWDDERFAYMALDAGGHWCGVDQEGVARAWPTRWIAAFTLPDGTRARRDGDHANGKPRFIKVQEGEK